MDKYPYAPYAQSADISQIKNNLEGRDVYKWSDVLMSKEIYRYSDLMVRTSKGESIGWIDAGFFLSPMERDICAMRLSKWALSYVCLLFAQ